VNVVFSFLKQHNYR